MIDRILHGMQIRTPAEAGMHPADELDRLRERIERAEQRRAALARTPQGWLRPDSPELAGPATGQGEQTVLRQRRHRVCGDVRALCHAVLAAPGAGARAGRFVMSEHPTDPVGARGLGCLLYLISGEGEGARFWWRYAAGIGDGTAAYLTFLEALLRGEHQEAAHCYHALHAEEFLCDDDFEAVQPKTGPAASPSSAPGPDRAEDWVPVRFEGCLHDVIAVAGKELTAAA